jgi:Flp pilus assembly protein TadD
VNEAQRHLRQSPLSASAYGLAGQCLLLAGQGDQARAMLAKARRLNPYDLSFDRP